MYPFFPFTCVTFFITTVIFSVAVSMTVTIRSCNTCPYSCTIASGTITPARGKLYRTYDRVNYYNSFSFVSWKIIILRGDELELSTGNAVRGVLLYVFTGYRDLRMHGRSAILSGCFQGRRGSSANVTRSTHPGLDRLDASGIHRETVNSTI